MTELLINTEKLPHLCFAESYGNTTVREHKRRKGAARIEGANLAHEFTALFSLKIIHIDKQTLDTVFVEKVLEMYAMQAGLERIHHRLAAGAGVHSEPVFLFNILRQSALFLFFGLVQTVCRFSGKKENDGNAEYRECCKEKTHRDVAG